MTRCGEWPQRASASASARAITRCPPSVPGGLEVTTAIFTGECAWRCSPGLPRRDNPRRNADRDRGGRHVFADDGCGADDRAIADRDAVENLGAGPDPGPLANRHAGGHAPLVEDRPRWIRKIVVAANHVRV